MNHLTIGLEDSIEKIVTKHPEAVDILKGLGFDQITNPMMLKTVGRVMTLPKVAKAKDVSLEKILQAFRDQGITVME